MKREFDQLQCLPVRRVSASAAPLPEIPALVRIAAQEIPSLAAAEAAVMRVQEKHPESIWAFRRGNQTVGIYAMLLLNNRGLERLLAGSIDFANPALECLSEPGTPVAAIYKWAVVARGTAAEGLHLMSKHLQGPHYAAANLYAKAVGAAAQRLDFNLGFTPVRPDDDLLIYVRMCNRAPLRAFAA
jgi:hypothetical protein